MVLHHILHVEDDADDALFVQRALGKAQVPCTVHRVENGDRAIEYLEGKGQFAAREQYPLPSLMLLDLKLPLVSGFEVLAWTRSQERFKSLLILILSGSGIEEDRARARELGANSFFVKTPHYSDVAQHVAQVLAGTVPPVITPPPQSFGGTGLQAL